MEGQYHSNTMRLINKYNYDVYLTTVVHKISCNLFIDQWFYEVGVVVLINISRVYLLNWKDATTHRASLSTSYR